MDVHNLCLHCKHDPCICGEIYTTTDTPLLISAIYGIAKVLERAGRKVSVMVDDVPISEAYMNEVLNTNQPYISREYFDKLPTIWRNYIKKQLPINQMLDELSKEDNDTFLFPSVLYSMCISYRQDDLILFLRTIIELMTDTSTAEEDEVLSQHLITTLDTHGMERVRYELWQVTRDNPNVNKRWRDLASVIDIIIDEDRPLYDIYSMLVHTVLDIYNSPTSLGASRDICYYTDKVVLDKLHAVFGKKLYPETIVVR